MGEIGGADHRNNNNNNVGFIMGVLRSVQCYRHGHTLLYVRTLHRPDINCIYIYITYITNKSATLGQHFIFIIVLNKLFHGLPNPQ